jgi:small subunit ribosomal protein S1
MSDVDKKVSEPAIANEEKLYSQFENALKQNVSLKELKKGDIVEGVVVDIRPEAIIVDVGYKSEGIVAGKEVRSNVIDVDKLKVGDSILVYVVKPEDSEGQLVLSIRRTEQAGQWLALEQARQNNDIIDAIVAESNKGGVICDLGGGIRGFLPTSQMDSSRIFMVGNRQVGKDISFEVQKKLSALIGTTMKVRISELNREKNKIILSEKMVTQEREIALKAKTLQKLKEGDVLHGEISGVVPYGVFVNAQGVEGLVHLSELSWDKVENIGDLYAVGDKVDVSVIGISDNGRRVAYSIKRLLPDPWSQAIAKYKVGDVVNGVITKVVPYGAFVRIGEGLNGLIHISEISDKLVKDPHDFVNEGDKVEVKVLSISSTERHLGLSLKAGKTISTGLRKDQTVDKASVDKAVEEVLNEDSK